MTRRGGKRSPERRPERLITGLDYGDKKDLADQMQGLRAREASSPVSSAALRAAAAQASTQQSQAAAAVMGGPVQNGQVVAGGPPPPPPDDLFAPTARPDEHPLTGLPGPMDATAPAVPSARYEIAAMYEANPNGDLANLLEWMDREGYDG